MEYTYKCHFTNRDQSAFIFNYYQQVFLLRYNFFLSQAGHLSPEFQK